MYISPAVEIIVCAQKTMSEAGDLKLGMSWHSVLEQIFKLRQI